MRQATAQFDDLGRLLKSLGAYVGEDTGRGAFDPRRASPEGPAGATGRRIEDPPPGPVAIPPSGAPGIRQPP